jgi:hypothetical protein
MERLRKTTTWVLLLFVVLSLGKAFYLSLGALASGSQPTAETVSDSTTDSMVAYYFHSKKRCATCRTIESLARKSLAPAVESQSLAWRVVNYQDPEHRHFTQTFDLYAASVILVQMRGTEIVRWKNLERVWELNDDPDAFQKYIQIEWKRFQENQG